MIQLTGNDLSLADVIQVAYHKEKVQLAEDAITRINSSHEILKKNLKKDFPFYGINTGYGIFHTEKINNGQIAALNRNLIISHAIGAGDVFSDEITRAAMLIRANTLAKGFSGVRLELIQTLIAMLNSDVIPYVRSQGSMGSSGDLCQLAQLALVVTRDQDDKESESGRASYQGSLSSGKAAMKKAVIERLILQPKEGLALINGATFSAAIAAIQIFVSKQLCETADSALALSMEALLGRQEAFDIRLHQARGLQGQIRSAENVTKKILGSDFVNSSDHVQDGYSVRCAPQVHGAVRDTVAFVENTINHEINAATDNPLIFENGDVLSGGNFHGEPIAMAMDYLSIAVSELGSISERRTFRLLDSSLNNGLPLMLISDEEKMGYESGLMIPQYSAASLVMENQQLANSDAVLSIPTSANQEDHNSNSLNAARHMMQISKNVLRILAIELYCAAHAVDIRKNQYPNKKLGQGTEQTYQEIRQSVSFKEKDTLWGEEINTLLEKLSASLFLVN